MKSPSLALPIFVSIVLLKGELGVGIVILIAAFDLLSGGTAQRVQCLRSCDGAGLGRFQTISECCVGGVNGGAFLYQVNNKCRNCADFQG